MAWEKGQSGNPEGRKPNKPFLDALQRAIAQEDAKRIRDAAEKLLTAAANGEPWALQMLADRLDGKPKQQVDVGNADGEAFQTITRIELVAPDVIGTD